MAKIKEGVKTEVNAKKMLFFQWEEEKKQNWYSKIYFFISFIDKVSYN